MDFNIANKTNILDTLKDKGILNNILYQFFSDDEDNSWGQEMYIALDVIAQDTKVTSFYNNCTLLTKHVILDKETTDKNIMIASTWAIYHAFIGYQLNKNKSVRISPKFLIDNVFADTNFIEPIVLTDPKDKEYAKILGNNAITLVKLVLTHFPTGEVPIKQNIIKNIPVEFLVSNNNDLTMDIHICIDNNFLANK